MSDDERDEQPPDDDGKPQKNENGEWVCPECGEAFAHAITLGAHRKAKHGVAGKGGTGSRRRRGGSGGVGGSRAARKQESRKASVKRSLIDLADLSDALRGRDDGGELPERLADLIRADADAIAEVIAQLAARVNLIALGVDRVLVLVAPALGLNRVLRWVLRAWRRQIAERAEAVSPDEWPPEMGEAPWRQEETTAP